MFVIISDPKYGSGLMEGCSSLPKMSTACLLPGWKLRWRHSVELWPVLGIEWQLMLPTKLPIGGTICREFSQDRKSAVEGKIAATRCQTPIRMSAGGSSTLPIDRQS